MTPRTVPDQLAYNAEQAAILLGLPGEAAVRRLVRRGVLSKVPHVGDRILIARAELERFVNGGTS